MTEQPRQPQQMLEDAFHHLQSAIELLDAAEAPGTIAAHADLAARQLETLIGQPDGKLTRPGAADGAWRPSLTS